MNEFGIAPQNHLLFINLLKHIEGIVPPNTTAAPETIICLPPTLNMLTGFRGLLLHRKYLQSSASREYTPPERSERVTITECTDGMTADSNRQLDVSSETNVEMESLPNNRQERPGAVFPIISERVDSPQTEAHCSESRQAITSSQENGEKMNSSATLPNEESVSDSDEPMPERGSAEDSTIEAANGTFNEMPSITDSEVDGENEDAVFGDRRADSLLLSRLLTLFYWPGIMSTLP